jgi:CRP/FNR family transcriptional regulator, cyclic AMP receptor protein
VLGFFCGGFSRSIPLVLLRTDAKASLIKTVPLFAGCSKRELSQIASIADELDLPEGATLTREGQQGREFLVLVTGTADVKHGAKLLAKLGDGDFLGEIALVLDVPRSATVTATSPVRLLVIERRAFKQLLRDVPAIQTKVLEALASRLADEST